MLITFSTEKEWQAARLFMDLLDTHSIGPIEISKVPGASQVSFLAPSGAPLGSDIRS